MKNLITNLFLITILVSSCQKGNDLALDKPTALPDKTVAKPTASFKITNFFLLDNSLKEDDVLDFDNKSTNADSYYWDFGNGTYSTDKIPVNVSFAPCGSTYTISLTVKNKSGDAVTYSGTFNILCKGKHVQTGG
jgi:hypothetical protein